MKLSHSFSFALKIGKFLLWPKTMATEVSHLLCMHLKLGFLSQCGNQFPSLNPFYILNTNKLLDQSDKY